MNHNQTQPKTNTFFQFDYEKWEGVPRFNIYLLRLMFLLMVFALGKDV